ncbi:peptidylprolyl isomerase [Tepiditoga spiralis]|nr:peptidylprolyl isomerase [Tepiditoga spiralis]
MKRVLLGFYILIFVAIGFSEPVSYLTSKDGKIYEKYFIDFETLKSEYLSSSNKEFFEKANTEYSIIKGLIDFLVIDKYLNDKNITIDSTSIKNNAQEMFNKYKNNENVLKIYGTLDDFYNYLKVQMWKNEIITKVKKVFFDEIKNEELDKYIKDNFYDIKNGYDRIKLKLITISNEASILSIKKEILDKKITFEDAAKKYSEDELSKNGGEIGWIDRNTKKYQPLFSLTINSTPNEVLGPIKIEDKYGLLLLEDKILMQTKEDILKDQYAVNKIKEIITQDKVSNWFKKYRDNYDFTVYYKPLIIEYRVDKAKDFKEKNALETLYREKLKTEKDIPDEWYLSYDKLSEYILKDRLSYKQDLTVYYNEIKKYPEYFGKNKEEIDKEIEKLKKIESTDDSTINVQKAVEKEDILNDLLYYSEFYTFKTIEEIKTEMKKIDEYISELEKIKRDFLIKLYKKNEDTENSAEIISTIFKKYPKDPYIKFEYTKLIYSKIKDLKSKDIEKLKQIKTIFESLLNEDSLSSKVKDEIKKYITEIKAEL